jgi:hypothetical protein
MEVQSRVILRKDNEGVYKEMIRQTFVVFSSIKFEAQAPVQ